MLEKPDLNDETILRCLRTEYGLSVQDFAFLPLGADRDTAVYRIVTSGGTAFFIKLRRGAFDKASLAVPNYLSRTGIQQIIPSLPTQSGQLYASLPPFTLILYPFVDGLNGFERPLSGPQWVEFGAALKRFHSASIPAEITASIPRETFSPRWRDTVRTFLARIEAERFAEPIAAELAAFLKIKSAETRELVEQTSQMAQQMQTQPRDFILCHADMHAWNLLVTASGSFYIVDWDTLIFAPKERDLMFIGSGLHGGGHTPQEEEALFYRGYGPTPINPIAIAYYRFERIIEDIGVYCEQIFLSDEGGEDRAMALENVKSNYLSGGTIDLARQPARFFEDGG